MPRDIDGRTRGHGRPIPDSQKLLRMFKATTKYIDRIGVELEGGWDDEPSGMKHDGSVRVQASFVGEIAGPPKKFGDGLRWVYDHNPPYVNETCGMHVHMSFKRPLDYARLADSEQSLDYVNKKLIEWGKNTMMGRIRPKHPFWARLTGENQYCRKNWHPEVQMNANGRSGQRYSMFNFCYGEHKTLEVRTLPAFSDPIVAVDAIYNLVRSIETYLQTVPKEREKRLVYEIDASETVMNGRFELHGDVDLAQQIIVEDEVDTSTLHLQVE